MRRSCFSFVFLLGFAHCALADAQGQPLIKPQVSALRTMLEMYTYTTTTAKGDQFPKIESKDIKENYDVTGKIKKNFEAILDDRISIMRNSLNNGVSDGLSKLELMGLEAIKMVDTPQGKKKIRNLVGDGSDIRILFKDRQFYIQFVQFPPSYCNGVEFSICGTEEDDDDETDKNVESAKKDESSKNGSTKEEGWFGF